MVAPITFKPAHPRRFTVGRGGHLPGWIVCHRMVGSLIGTDATFMKFDPLKPKKVAATHFGVGRRPRGGGVAISQYVDLDDTAFGNGNNVNDAGIEVDSRWNQLNFPSRPNRHTVSIEHEDRAAAHRGVVDEDIIAASIELVQLLLSGDPARVRAAGIRFRKKAVVEALGRIPRDATHIIDHHFIAGPLKPNCWRKWLDDPGFPQTRYLAALTGQAVPDVTGTETMAAGTGGSNGTPDGDDEMPLLEGRPAGRKIGIAQVRPQGSNFIFANNTRRPIAGGTVRNVMGLVKLDAPLDGHGGDRTTLLLVSCPVPPHWAFIVAGDTDWPAGLTLG
jgi:hypothetical protein